MSSFVPMQFVPQGPLGGVAPSAPSEPIPSPFQARIPVSRTCRLDEIAGEVVPTPGAVYEHDYFLLHPIDGALQRVWFAADLPTAQTTFRLKLVGDRGQDLTPYFSFESLPTRSTLLVDQIGAGAGGAVYLRAQTESQPARLFVTVELLVGEASE